MHLYVHPRMAAFVQMALWILGLMTLYQASETFTAKVRKYPPFRLGYFMMVLPLLFAFSGPAGALSTRLAGQKPVQLGAGTSGIPLDPRILWESPADPSEEQAAPKSEQPLAEPAPQPSSSPSPSPIPSALSFTEEAFIESLMKIHEDMEAHLGQRIALTGFIYRIGSFGPQEFVIARYLVSCCIADAQVVGLYAVYSDIEQKSPFVWIRAEGVLDQIEFQGEQIPILRVEHIEEIPAPENPYLYR